MNVRTSLQAVAFLTALVVLASSAAAQFAAPSDFADKTGRHLVVDWAAFKTEDPEKSRLEVYYQIFNRGLEFTDETDHTVAEYELTVTVRDDDDVRVESVNRDRRIVVASEDRAKSRFDFRTSQLVFELPPEKYKIKFALLDKTSGEVAQRELEVDLEDFDTDRPKMSTVEFVQAYQQNQGDKPGVFDKGDIVVIPSVTRVFGGEGQERMAYYLELYPGDDDDSQKVVVETKINRVYSGMVYRDTLHVTLTGKTERQLREISLEYLTPGEYEMEVFLRGRRNKKLDDGKYRFEILWTQEGMIRNDWKATISQLSLIAQNKELDGWKDLKTYEQRLQAYRQFWIERDPTIGTPANEVMLEFYHRIAVANHSFGMPRREGWRTDRGRIFIQFGHPDQVDDVPFAPNAFPYQIWHYYTEGRYRRFLFVDERDDGDYRLQYPYDGLGQRPDF